MTLPGYGTIDNAMDLATALAYGFIDPGDVVYLRGGTYTGNFVCSISGSDGSPITIKPYPGEHAIIDGTLTVTGNYLRIEGLEILNSDMGREASDPSGDNIESSGFVGGGIGNLFLDLIIHDVKFVTLLGGTGNEFHGCCSYYIGFSASDRGHGHAIYVNNTEDVAKYVRGCVLHSCFGWGVHAYTQSNNSLKYLRFDGVTAYESGVLYGTNYSNILIGGWGAADDFYDLIVSNCRCYSGNICVIGYNSGGDVCELTNLYTPDGLQINEVTNLTQTNVYSDSAIGNQAFVYANLYTAGRGVITVYNQAEAASVVVDVSDVLAPEAGYRLRNTRDYWDDVVTGTVALDGTITIDMQAVSHTVATPVNWDAPATTFPLFGAFMIEEV